MVPDINADVRKSYINCSNCQLNRTNLLGTSVVKMATKSFDEMMTIDTPEAARNLIAAYYEAEKRGPLKLPDIDMDAVLKEGEEFFRNNPDWFKEAAAKARERIIARGEELPDMSDEEWNELTRKF